MKEDIDYKINGDNINVSINVFENGIEKLRNNQSAILDDFTNLIQKHAKEINLECFRQKEKLAIVELESLGWQQEKIEFYNNNKDFIYIFTQLNDYIVIDSVNNKISLRNNIFQDNFKVLLLIASIIYYRAVINNIEREKEINHE